MNDRRTQGGQVLPTPTILKTYILETPVGYGNEKVYQLEFRELKTRDHLTVEKQFRDAGPIEKSFAYLMQITEQPKIVIENLCHKDFMACQDILVDFLGHSPESTTKT